MPWSGEHAGEYTRHVPDRRRRAGTRRKIEATRAGTTSAAPSRTSAPRRATPSTSTRRCTPARCGASPRRPAAAYYAADDTATLADDLRYTGRGVTTVEEHELWHMPIVLLLLVGLLCAEWGYRRVVGLP